MKLENSIYAKLIIEKYTFDFGDLFFLPNVIVAEFKEGILFTYKDAEKFISTAEAFYRANKVYYISNRINSYAVNPIDWIRINNKYKNLEAIGMVQYNSVGKRFLMIEKIFCSRPIKDFTSLDEAFNWVQKQIKMDREALKKKSAKKQTTL